MGFESRAISARVTKQIVTIFSKTCDKDSYPHNGLADKDSYPHDRHNQYMYIMLSLLFSMN